MKIFPSDVLPDPARVQMVIFDLDGTLAPSKNPPDEEMTGLFSELLASRQAALISGGAYDQLHNQFAAHLPKEANISNLSILAASGSALYRSDGNTWQEVYAENLTDDEKEKIESELLAALQEEGYEKPETTYGPIIEDRLSQITFSALGQEAPLSEKETWDPDRSIRNRIADNLRDRLGDGFSVGVGGSTSIDITRRGIDKAYGIRRISETLGIPLEQILFVGDALEPGGNDSAALETNVAAIDVTDPEETKSVIRWLLGQQEL